MLSKYSSVLAASAAVVGALTTPTTQCTNSCNPISRPGLNEPVSAGSQYAITWQPTTAGTVSLTLCHGPPENCVTTLTIAEKVVNSAGTYSWAVPTNLQSEVTHYGIQLINDADGTYQFSTQFGIIGGSLSSSSSSSSSSIPASSSSSSLLMVALSTPSLPYNTTYAAPTSLAVLVSASASAFTNTSVLQPSSPLSKPDSLTTTLVAAATTSATAATSATSSRTTTSTTSTPTGAAMNLQVGIASAFVAFTALFSVVL